MEENVQNNQQPSEPQLPQQSTQVLETLPNLEDDGKEKITGRLGKYRIIGGPGRPKGSVNKYTQIKNDIFDVWMEHGGKEKFIKLFNGSTKDFIKAMELIISLFPKNGDLFDQSQHTHVTYVWRKPDRDSVLANDLSIRDTREPETV